MSLPCGSLSQREDYGLITFRASSNKWVRSRLSAGGTTSATGDFVAPVLGHTPFWSKPVSTFGLFAMTTFSSASLMLTIPFDPSSRPPWCWRSHSSPHGSDCRSNEQGYIVTRASHPTVTSDACLGRILIAENQVTSCLDSRNNYSHGLPCRTRKRTLRKLVTLPSKKSICRHSCL